MRKVVSGLFMSLDGVVEAPDQWQFDVFDADMGAAMAAHLASEDTILLGRKTFEEWAPYWPTSTDEPYASHINNCTKIVVSSTLSEDDITWQNARLFRGSLAEEIGSLKAQPGKNIGVAGSITLARSLLEQGLLDQLVLMIHPVVAGRGRRLFPEQSQVKRMQLVDSQMTGSGVAILTYEPRPQD